MSCALTQGYTLDCKNSIGGIKAVWFIAAGDVSAVAEASGVVTSDHKKLVERYSININLLRTAVH